MVKAFLFVLFNVVMLGVMALVFHTAMNKADGQVGMVLIALSMLIFNYLMYKKG
jgi:hypothetical protein